MTSRTRTTPPYTITSTILDLSERIGEAISRAEEAAVRASLRLRRINRIRTIQGSLAIEGNTLTEEQISTILEGKPVVAPLREIQEVRNAIKAYEQFPQWNPASETDLLSAHEMLMVGLLDAPGHYRRGGVAVTGAGEVHHIGPPASRVPHAMSNLLSWLGGTGEHPLIASSVFHYEFEFIHPFKDGNGRMGTTLADLDTDALEAPVCRRSGGEPDSCAPERVLRGYSRKLGQGREHPVHRLHAKGDS